MTKSAKTSGRRAPAEREGDKHNGSAAHVDDSEEASTEEEAPAPNDSVMARYGGLIVPGVLFGLILLAILATLLRD
jgi:hypothetical protein